MAENLVIVESPAKARTIKKYLGKDFDVLASYGHVRDLVPKEGAVDPDQGFAMQYQVLEKNERHIEAITRALRIRSGGKPITPAVASVSGSSRSRRRSSRTFIFSPS